MSECLLRWPPEHSRLASSQSWMHYSSAAAGKTASTGRPKWTYLRGVINGGTQGTESFQVSVSRSSGSLALFSLSLLASSLTTVLRTCFCFDDDNRLLFFVLFFALSLSFSRSSLNQALCLRLRQWFPCKITLATVILHAHSHTQVQIFYTFLQLLPFKRKCTCTNTTLPTLSTQKNLFSGYLDWWARVLFFFFFFVVHSFRQQTPPHQYTLTDDCRASLLTFCGCWRER